MPLDDLFCSVNSGEDEVSLELLPKHPQSLLLLAVHWKLIYELKFPLLVDFDEDHVGDHRVEEAEEQLEFGLLLAFT